MPKTGIVSNEECSISTARKRGHKTNLPIKSPLTKADTIIKCLGRAKGASVADLMAATGWQAHSIRGFISGTVRKRMGLAIDLKRDAKGTSRYRIVPFKKN